MLGARAAQQVSAGPPSTRLEQFEAEDVVQSEPCEGGFLPHDSCAQRALEPFRRRRVARCLQLLTPHKNTSELRMLQVKYAAKCQSNQTPSGCGRCAHSPTITSGSSSRPARRPDWSRSIPAS